MSQIHDRTFYQIVSEIMLSHVVYHLKTVVILYMTAMTHASQC